MAFDLFNNLEIVNHIKSNSFIFKPNNSQEWIQVLCPYCDDATRKSNIDHGHFYISRFTNFCQCFRCESRQSIKKYLIDIGFKNNEILNQIFRFSNIKYNKEHIYKSNQINYNDTHINYMSQYNNYKSFVKYIIYRLGYVDFEFFKIYPLIINGVLTVGFNNYYNNFITARFIENNKQRYYKSKDDKFYFFQNPFEYTKIVITEGVFDLINLYNYSTVFDKDTFYISINGRNYNSAIKQIVSEYFMIGNYEIHIVLDNDINNLNLKNLVINNNILNPKIKYRFWKPIMSKDISELNLIESCQK